MWNKLGISNFPSLYPVLFYLLDMQESHMNMISFTNILTICLIAVTAEPTGKECSILILNWI